MGSDASRKAANQKAQVVGAQRQAFMNGLDPLGAMPDPPTMDVAEKWFRCEIPTPKSGVERMIVKLVTEDGTPCDENALRISGKGYCPRFKINGKHLQELAKIKPIQLQVQDGAKVIVTWPDRKDEDTGAEREIDFTHIQVTGKSVLLMPNTVLRRVTGIEIHEGSVADLGCCSWRDLNTAESKNESALMMNNMYGAEIAKWKTPDENPLTKEVELSCFMDGSVMSVNKTNMKMIKFSCMCNKTLGDMITNPNPWDCGVFKTLWTDLIFSKEHMNY